MRAHRDRAGNAAPTLALNRQAFAAFCATRVDDFAAAGGLHADPKAMGALAARNRRLVGTFHVALTRSCWLLLGVAECRIAARIAAAARA